MPLGAFAALEQSYRDVRWSLDPVAATQAGIPTHDDRYGRYSTAALAPHLAALRSLASALEEVETESLDDEIDRTALLNEIRVTVRRFERERAQAKNPGFWLSHLLGGLHFLMLRRDRSPADRTSAIIGRMEDIPAFLDDARAGLVEPVRLFAETALRIIEGGIELVQEVGATVADEAPAFATRVGAAKNSAVGALASFRSDLGQWLDTGSDHFALGEDDFDFRLHYEHALRDTAPELWRYGHHLQQEVEADLTTRSRRLQGSGDWHAVVDRLRADHPTAGTLVQSYAQEMARARDFVAARGLAPIPDAPLDVVPTPAFMRPIIPFAAYDSPGPYSTDRTGWFYVTVPDPKLPAGQQERVLRDHCRFELPATALHEGYPGHHLQLVLAQQQASHVRRYVWTPLTVEGWALYCEDMMADEGFYSSEEEILFQRVHLLWRAVRIVLDVGLHTRAMTFDQAVDQLVDKVHLDRANAEAEVRRYCAEPGYQLCYAVGRRELLKLRDDYRAARGSDFTLPGFHKSILQYGGLPVALIRWGLNLSE